MPGPDARTRLAGVVGHPVAHSLSPAIHNAALRYDKHNAVYLAFDVEPVRFEAFVDGMRAAGARGLNVTLPHKGAAHAVSTERSDEAALTAAVNTLVFEEEKVVGHNTDVAGINRTLAKLGGARGDVLVIGAGGAARAAVHALGEAGGTILVANRTESRAREVVEMLGPRGRVVPWGDVDEAVASVALIVNATSVGLDGSSSPLTTAALERAASAGCRQLLDLVYGRQETPLVRRARQAGLEAADGLEVLVQQAGEAYRLLWGGSPPVDVMRDEARRAAGRG